MLNLKNTEKKQKSFMYQNLQKSKCFNVNFSKGNFNYASFRGAHMKACNFSGCTFVEAEFVGTNLKESQFKNAHFENTLFEGAKLEGVDFKGATFKNVIFVETDLTQALNLDLSNPGITVYETMPIISISPALEVAVRNFIDNDFVKRSRVLDNKHKALNTVSILRLLQHFSETDLTKHFITHANGIGKDFYTLSYLIKLFASHSAEVK